MRAAAVGETGQHQRAEQGPAQQQGDHGVERYRRGGLRSRHGEAPEIAVLQASPAAISTAETPVDAAI